MLLDTPPTSTLMAGRSNSVPRNLVATSSALPSTTSNLELRRSPVPPHSAFMSSGNYQDGHEAEVQTHPLRYTGAGRFWKPPDERNLKHSRLRDWMKRSHKVDDNGFAVPQLPAVNVSNIGIDEGPVSPQLKYRKPLNSHQSLFDRPSTGGSRHSFSAQSTVSAHTPNPSPVTPITRTGSEPGDVSSIDMLDEKIDSLAARIAIDERRLRIQEQLKKLQRDEEDRLKQLDMDDSQSSESPTPDLSRNASDASNRPLPNHPTVPKTPHNPHSDDLGITIIDEIQPPATETTNHWDDLRELQDLHPTVSKSSNSSLLDLSRSQVIPLPEPSHYSIPPIAELPDPQTESSPPPENDSVFSDLDFIVGVLRSKPKSSPVPSQRSRAPSHDSNCSSSLLQRKLSPSSKPYPAAIELTAPSPAPPPPTNLVELSSSKSVIHRPEVRRQAPRYRYDLTAYNTLQGEPFPILKSETSVELPAEELKQENHGQVQYNGPPISIEPDFDPRTGVKWAGR